MAFGIANYTSDNGLTFNLRMSQAHYTASGLANGDLGDPLYPVHWTPRKVHGKSEDGVHHASLVVAEGAALWTGADNEFTIGTQDYVVTGRTGEKRPELAQPFA